MKKLLILSVLFLFSFAWTQETVKKEDVAKSGLKTDITGFAGYKLGMTMDEVKAIYSKDPLFIYVPEPDVNMLNRPNQTLLEVFGKGFIRRAFFQFYENKLYSLILVLNSDKVDFLSVTTSLEQKYGAFTLFSPQKVEWDNGSSVVSLEKPLSVKYLDKKVLETIAGESQLSADMETLTLKKFLEKL